MNSLIKQDTKTMRIETIVSSNVSKSSALLLLLALIFFSSLVNSEQFEQFSKTPDNIYESLTLAELRNHKPLKISMMEDNPPYSIRTSDGTLTGLYVEYWQLWSNVNGVRIEFVPNTFAENIKALKAGTIDFDSGLFADDSRRQWAVFSDKIDRIDSGLFYLSEQTNVESLSDLSGKKVAIQQGSYQADFVKRNFPNVSYVEIWEPKLQVKSLFEKEVIAIVGEIPNYLAEFERLDLRGAITLSKEIITSNDVHAVIPINKSYLLNAINQGIRNLPQDEVKRLSKKWLPNSQLKSNQEKENRDALFPGEIKTALKDTPFLLAGIDTEWPPIEFVDDQGNHQGISADYLKIIENQLSLEVRIDKNVHWNQVMRKIKKQQIDLLPAVTISDDRKTFLNFTKPYIEFPVVIVTRKNTIYVQSVNDLIDLEVGTTAGSHNLSYWRKNYPSMNLTIFDSAHEGFEALNDNKIDAYIENLATATQEINRHFGRIAVAALTEQKLSIAIGVRKGLEELLPILNTIIDNIPADTHSQIRKYWLISSPEDGTEFLVYIFASSPIFIFFAAFIYWLIRANRQLNNELRKKAKTQESLNIAKKNSESANREKDEFMANMSHEIRTPMNALVGLSHLLSISDLSSQQRSCLDAINHSTNSLLLLVNDISDLSKVDTGELELKNTAFDLKKLFKNIAAQTRVNLADKSVVFSYEIGSEVDAVLIGDQHRLGQVINNLVSNAIKFTEKGTIKLRAFYTEGTKKGVGATKAPRSVKLNLSVTDTGIGISETNQKRLFNPFTQAKTSTTRVYGGTGLGLQICKKLVELMGGSIEIESNEGKGSCFNFSVALLKSDQVIRSNEDAPSTASMKQKTKNNDIERLKNKEVLIVDDNMVNLLIAKKILLNEGVKVTTAKDGQEAVNCVEEKVFDMILMDIQMPVLDGYQATRKIRNELGNTKVPIIAVSANTQERDVRLSIEAGMNEHVSKPIDVAKLLDTMLKFI